MGIQGMALCRCARRPVQTNHARHIQWIWNPMEPCIATHSMPWHGPCCATRVTQVRTRVRTREHVHCGRGSEWKRKATGKPGSSLQLIFYNSKEWLHHSPRASHQQFIRTIESHQNSESYSGLLKFSRNFSSVHVPF